MRPGAFFLTGCGNVDKGITAPHHNPHFDIDESAFKYAASVFLKILELEHVFTEKLRHQRYNQVSSWRSFYLYNNSNLKSP